MSARRKPAPATPDVTLDVPAGAETQVSVGEPILPHGVSWSVRCKIEDVPAVSLHLVTLAREIERSWRFARTEMPMADGVPGGAIEVPEEQWDGARRRRIGL